MADVTLDLSGVPASDLKVFSRVLYDARDRFSPAGADVLLSLGQAFEGELSRRETGAPGGPVVVPLTGAASLTAFDMALLLSTLTGFREMAVQELRPPLVMAWHSILLSLAGQRDSERAAWKRIARSFIGLADDTEAGELVPETTRRS